MTNIENGFGRRAFHLKNYFKNECNLLMRNSYATFINYS